MASTFSSEQKSELIAELEVGRVESRQNARLNQRLDVLFKIALLILAIATTVCAGVITAFKDKPPDGWPLANTILAGISTVLSAFAFSQFNFNARQRGWLIKTDAIASLRRELQYSEPERDAFRVRADAVLALDGDTLTDASTLQKGDKTTPAL